MLDILILNFCIEYSILPNKPQGYKKHTLPDGRISSMRIEWKRSVIRRYRMLSHLQEPIFLGILRKSERVTHAITQMKRSYRLLMDQCGTCGSFKVTAADVLKIEKSKILAIGLINL